MLKTPKPQNPKTPGSILIIEQNTIYMEFNVDIHTASKIRIIVKTIGAGDIDHSAYFNNLNQAYSDEMSNVLKVKAIIESKFDKILLDNLPGKCNEK